MDAVVRRRSTEELDSTLISHALLFLSDHAGRYHSDERFLGSLDLLTKQRSCPQSASHSNSSHHQPSDRVWSLCRSSDITNPLVLCGVAERQNSIQVSCGNKSRVVRSNVAYEMELGFDFFNHCVKVIDENDYPETFRIYQQRKTLETVGLQPSAMKQLEIIMTDIDSLIRLHELPFSACMSKITRGLSIAVPLHLRISTSRLLIRLAKVKQLTHSLAEAILILDDIESTVVPNSPFQDLGLFFLTRAETLLKLSNGFPEDEIDLMADSLRNLQLAISAFDKAQIRTEELLKCVALAAACSNKLDLSSHCNFYAVKYHQISAAYQSGRATRFFPDEDATSVFSTGQPKLPSELILSPKSSKFVSPLSPVGTGRGLQTLVSWNSRSSLN